MPQKAATRVITVMNQKGGVGKTTVAVNLAHGLARRGHPSLIIDFDPQGSVAHKLNINPDSAAMAFLVNDTNRKSMVSAIRDMVVPTGRENLFILPGDKSTSNAIAVLTQKELDEVRRRIECVFFDTGYRYIFLDTSPSVGGMQEQAAWAADYIIIPITPEDGAVKGLHEVLADLTAMSQHPVERLRWRGALLGILLNEYRENTRTSRETLEILNQYFKDRILGPIHREEVFPQSEGAGKTIWEYDPKGRGVAEYSKIVDTILRAR